jgi:hypothetical protein
MGLCEGFTVSEWQSGLSALIKLPGTNLPTHSYLMFEKLIMFPAVETMLKTRTRSTTAPNLWMPNSHVPCYNPFTPSAPC